MISHDRPITLPTCAISPPQWYAQHTFCLVIRRVGLLVYHSEIDLIVCFAGTSRGILVLFLPSEELHIADIIYSSPRSHLLQRKLGFLQSNPSQIHASQKDPCPLCRPRRFMLRELDSHPSLLESYCTILSLLGSGSHVFYIHASLTMPPYHSVRRISAWS